jgi:hypothetical protein
MDGRWIAEGGPDASGPIQARRGEGSRGTDIDPALITKVEKGEDLSHRVCKPTRIPLACKDPVTGGAFDALVLVDDRFPIFVEIDHTHRADGMAVAAADTFLLVDLHKAPLQKGEMDFMVKRDSSQIKDEKIEL